MVGPDGSLCRINSSAEEYKKTNMYFVKVPDDQRKEFKLPYSLVIVGGKDSDIESPSEKSDDEFLDEDLSDFVFPPKNVVKISEKICDTNDKIDETSDVNKPKKKDSLEEQNNNNTKKPNNNQSCQFSGRRKFKTSKQGGMKYSKHISNSSKAGERNYNKNYNSNRRNYHPLDSPAAYNNNVQNCPSNDIEPWLNPPLLNYELYPYPYFANPVDTVVQSPMNSCPENSVKSKGLLGESPYSPHPYPPNFQKINQNESYISDQNYWGKEYFDYHCVNYDTGPQNCGSYQGGSFQSNRPAFGPVPRKYFSPKKDWKKPNRIKPYQWNKKRNYQSTARLSSNTFKNNLNKNKITSNTRKNTPDTYKN